MALYIPVQPNWLESKVSEHKQPCQLNTPLTLIGRAIRMFGLYGIVFADQMV